MSPSPDETPIEDEILAELRDVFFVSTRPAAGAELRFLEGGEGVPLVLLHGRSHCASMWFPVLKALSRTHRVIAIDLPGFGASTAPDRRTPDGEQALRFFVEPIEALIGSVVEGATEVTLIGHSLGGLVALELALRGRLKVARLVLVDSMGLGPQMNAAARLFFNLGPERVARTAGRKFFGVIAATQPTPVGRRVAALEYELLTARGGRSRASAAFTRLAPLTGAVFNRRDRLFRLTVPTLIMWGENDSVFPPSVGRAAAKLMPKAEVEVFPLGHSPHLESYETFLPELRRFL